MSGRRSITIWSKIYHAAEALIAGKPADQWDDRLKGEFLYILARDNECENILEKLIQSPELLIALAGHAVTFTDWLYQAVAVTRTSAKNDPANWSKCKG